MGSHTTPIQINNPPSIILLRGLLFFETKLRELAYIKIFNILYNIITIKIEK